MNLFEKLLQALSKTMEIPSSYGWFHLLFIALVIITTVLLCIFYRKSNEKVYSRICMIMWIIIFVLEIYKELLFSISFGENGSFWSYQWYIFPYQFCSTPLYVMPFIFLLKEKSKVREACKSFMAFYSLFAGICVFIYPEQCFCQWIGINIQSLVHHGIMVIFGIYTICHDFDKIETVPKFFIKGIYVFVVLSLMAIGLNVCIPTYFHQPVNLFFISPYFQSTLPVLSLIYPKVPYIIFLLVYLIGFSLSALLFHAIAYVIKIIINSKTTESLS